MERSLRSVGGTISACRAALQDGMSVSALEDRTGDAAYLEALRADAQRALELARAELAIYLAGADPFAGDSLGRLALSKSGLAERDLS